MTQIARRVGWKTRRKLRVIGAKAPVFDGDPQDDLDYGDDYWHGCGVDGCCVDSDWAVGVMPPMTFGMDGLVHVTMPGDPRSACGEEGNFPVPGVGSTDEAIEYARAHGGDVRQVTCLKCIVLAPLRGVPWTVS